MENFAPGLREAIVGLTDSLRFVVFFIAVVGLMIRVQRSRADMESLVRPVVRCVLVIALVATLPHWFSFTERLFLNVADAVNERYSEHPMQAATLLRDSVAETPGEWSLRRVGESLYRATLWAAAKLLVLVASLLQLPFLLLQHLLKLLCYLFLPVALALMLVPSLASLGTRYVQQTLAVLAWPVGFAVTELVAYHLLTAYQQNLATAYGLAPGEINAASFASLLGGLLAALWLILGTVGTPFLMQALICSGAPLSGGGHAGLQQINSVRHLAWLIKSAGATRFASAIGGGGAGSTPGGPGSAARGGPSAAPPPAPPQAVPRTHGPAPAAPLPAPQTTI